MNNLSTILFVGLLGLSLLEIRVTDIQPRRDAAGVTSLLCAAALLEPKELVLALPSGYMGNLSPLFFLQLPDHVRFHELETLSLLGCHVRFDSLLPCCPRLRVLRLKFNDRWGHNSIRSFMSLHSTSLQEICVDVENVSIDTVDLVAPELKKLTVSLKAFREVNISILAPMLEKLSWKCSYSFINFGPWRIAKLWLQKAERQGELPSLLIHARISSSIVHGEAENSTQEIEKHMLAKFSVLELHLRPKGHAFGAFMFHLLGMNRFFRATQRLKVVLQRSALKQECPLDCACDHPDWRSRTSSLTALEEVEISGFQGYDHEIDFLKLIHRYLHVIDSADEMMVQLFTKELNAQAVLRQQQQLILTNMLRVRQPFFVVPRRGGSKLGKRRNINRHRKAGAMLFDADYFNNDATHSPKEFRRRFRMNKELFLKIVHGVREYDKYFMAKKHCTGL
ncbi:uncharacterized protein [Lolium perenne]|uniref:uncharacterized protein n=1 Tax=Lolium perenne TaxID=4522 RepID=UPI0021F51A58|nr:uncharacterized protein LOC127314974 [Lolium perenne]